MNRMSEFESLASMKPMIGPMGDDLLLRAIHAGFLRSTVHLDDHIEAAIRLGLVLKLRRNDVGIHPILLRVTDRGALYWQTRGGDFSKFIYQCPPLDALALQADTDKAPSTP